MEVGIANSIKEQFNSNDEQRIIFVHFFELVTRWFGFKTIMAN